MKCEFRIKGLDCANCANDLERSIKKVRGVEKASISYMSEKMVIEVDEKDKKSVIKDIERLISKEEPDVTIKEI